MQGAQSGCVPVWGIKPKQLTQTGQSDRASWETMDLIEGGEGDSLYVHEKATLKDELALLVLLRSLVGKILPKLQRQGCAQQNGA